MTILLLVIFFAVWGWMAWHDDPERRELLRMIDRERAPERIARNLERRYWW